VPYLSASGVVIHYEQELYQVYAPLAFTFTCLLLHLLLLLPILNVTMTMMTKMMMTMTAEWWEVARYWRKTLSSCRVHVTPQRADISCQSRMQMSDVTGRIT